MTNSGLRAARRAVLGGANGSAANSIWPGTPSTTRPTPRPERHRQTAEIDLESGTISTRPKQPWLSSSPAIATPPAQAGRNGSRKHPWKAFAVFHPNPSTTRKRLRTSNPMERSIQQELKRRTVKVRVIPRRRRAAAPRQRRPRPRSTKNGPQTQRPTSSGNARMHDPLSAEFPDKRFAQSTNPTDYLNRDPASHPRRPSPQPPSKN